MSSQDRKLTEFVDGIEPDPITPDPDPDPDPNPGAEPAGVDPDREPLDEDELDDECADCDSPSVEYDDPADALDHPELPSKPLCRSCILDRL